MFVWQIIMYYIHKIQNKLSLNSFACDDIKVYKKILKHCMAGYVKLG